MTHAFTRSLSATAAISAVLALGSSPAFAQDAAPAIEVPPVASAPSMPDAAAAPSIAAPPAVQPAIVLPDVGAAPVTATAEASSPAPRQRASSASRVQQPRATATQPAAARTQTAAVAPAQTLGAPRSATAERPRASSANILNDAPTRPASAERIAPRPAAVSSPASRSDDGFATEAVVGLLAALGLGAVGYAALRSRRRRADLEDDVYLDSAVAEMPVEEELEQAPRTAPVFGAPPTAPRDRDVRYGFRPAHGSGEGDTQVMEREPAVMAPPLATRPERTGAGFAMPAGAPTSAEERTALLDRMVAAEPDEANPFTSTKARRKRARLILQRHETESRRDTPFDWRSYRSATRPTIAASRPLVTA